MMRVVEVLDRSGHLSLTWDPAIPESVERARGDFEVLQQAGYQFFRVLNQDEPTGFAPHEGALVVKRVDASDVAPVAAPAQPTRAVRRGRKPKAEPGQERTVAMRPMRGG
jgi:hypothetical protein